MRFEICLVTNRGNVRKNNEDGFYINNMGCYNTDECFIYEKVDAPILTFVADGVGSSSAGEEATRLCIETAYLEPIPHDDIELIGLIDKINKKVSYTRKTLDTACTIAGILLGEDCIYWFDIGDSRVFTLNQGYLNQLSVDDTPSGISGEITFNKEPLIQYLGKENVIPHVGEIEKLSTFLICTDGLTDMVSIDEIETIIQENAEIKTLALSLVTRAKEKGGLDNITIIIVKPTKEEITNG